MQTKEKKAAAQLEAEKLQGLQKMDNSAVRIIFETKTGSIYLKKADKMEWQGADSDGKLVVYERTEDPYFCVLIPSDIIESLSSKTEIDLDGSVIKFGNCKSIEAFYFPNASYTKKLYDTMKRLVNSLKKNEEVIEEGSPNIRVTTQPLALPGGIPDIGNIHSSMLSNFPNLAISSPSVVGTQTGNITSIRVTNTSIHAVLDVSNYNADSLKVTVIDQSIIVEGSHGEKEDTYETIESTFKRRSPLPTAIPPESVQSQLTADGHLTIDAKAPEPKQEGARPIQIIVINTIAAD